MRVKRFQAMDMQSALETVSGKLGPDAVIISTRRLGTTPAERRGGLRGVEIIAGVDEQAAARTVRQTPPAPAAIGAAAALARAAYTSNVIAPEAGRTPARAAGAATAGVPGETLDAVSDAPVSPSPAVSRAHFPSVDRHGDPIVAADPLTTPFADLLRRATRVTEIPAAVEAKPFDLLADGITDYAGGEVLSDLRAAPELASPAFAPALPHYVPASSPARARPELPATDQPLNESGMNGTRGRAASQAEAAPSAAQAAAESAYDLLRAAGLSDDVAEAALEQAIKLVPTAALGDGRRLVEVALARLTAGLPAGPELEPRSLANKALVFVGPAGAGKTTALLKTALELRRRGADVSVIGADVSHLGAREQLHRYGEVLNLPVQIAYSAVELSRLLSSMTPGRIALVDTPACRLGDHWNAAGGSSNRGIPRATTENWRSHTSALSEQSEELLALVRAVPDRVVVLTAAAGIGEADLSRLAAVGRALDAAAAVITKIDETSARVDEDSGAGSVLNVLAHLRLSPLLCSTGRDVLADVRPQTAAQLAAAAVASVAGSAGGH